RRASCMLPSDLRVPSAPSARNKLSKNSVDHTDWSAYATAYDLLSLHNPAYRELLGDFRSFIGKIDQPEVIYDIGGGTGNYTEIAAELCPGSKIRLIEPDPRMIAIAKSKLSSYNDITFDTRSMEETDALEKADLVICVHALYAMTSPEKRLRQLAGLLRPGGMLFLIDLGRELDLAHWRRYLLRHLFATHGLLGAARITWQGREIARQNRQIRNAQKAGDYWTYEEGELAGKVAEAGFEVLRSRPAYLGYSDLVVARRRL
ncbi:MAG: methyltransferase domain-containing protein, partial [Henriciella sp.]|uniref:class I SAM-dependent methyltransferase n=1 Tax=Henriciella sp. TaxID=1968823 RepID=UPI003C71760E